MLAVVPLVSQDLTNAGSVSASRRNRHLVGVDQPVVLRVEDAVHGGQCDVLVAAAIAGNKVQIEHFVVVGVRVFVVCHEVGGVDYAVTVNVEVEVG